MSEADTLSPRGFPMAPSVWSLFLTVVAGVSAFLRRALVEQQPTWAWCEDQTPRRWIAQVLRNGSGAGIGRGSSSRLDIEPDAGPQPPKGITRTSPSPQIA